MNVRWKLSYHNKGLQLLHFCNTFDSTIHIFRPLLYPEKKSKVQITYQAGLSIIQKIKDFGTNRLTLNERFYNTPQSLFSVIKTTKLYSAWYNKVFVLGTHKIKCKDLKPLCHNFSYPDCHFNGFSIDCYSFPTECSAYGLKR